MRYFLDISYKGTNFHGWQRQLNAATIQEEIEKALSLVLREETAIVGSGRTDAGVHATQQIAHFDVTEQIDPDQLCYKLNGILSDDISINSIVPVKPDAHARFDATSRKYVYRITTKKDPFQQRQISFYPKLETNVDFLNKLASQFLGTQDFESFSKVHSEVNNFLCSITHAHWTIEKDEFKFTIIANRFLRGMVRAIVGTMLDINNGKIKEEDLPDIIEAKDRTKAGQAAKPAGLYLAKIEYPDEIYL